MKSLLKFSICLTILTAWSSFAEAKKRYRKRHHKLQTNIWLSLDNEFSFNKGSHLLVNYARNLGNLELGGLVGFIPDEGENAMDFNIGQWGLSAGGLVEWNIFKNKRRINWVPAVGLKVIYIQTNDPLVHLVPYFASKHFISTRTSLNIEVNSPWQVWEWSSEFQDLFQGVSFSLAYAYYFH